MIAAQVKPSPLNPLTYPPLSGVVADLKIIACRIVEVKEEDVSRPQLTDLYPGHCVEARENHHESDAEDGDVDIFYSVGLHDQSWCMITVLMSGRLGCSYM